MNREKKATRARKQLSKLLGSGNSGSSGSSGNSGKSGNSGIQTRMTSNIQPAPPRMPEAKKSPVRVVVAIDFGTTNSGFAYSHKLEPSELETNDVWPGHAGQFKTNTVLLYDENWSVEKWGRLALAQAPMTKKSVKLMQIKGARKPVELFKLHLGDVPERERTELPTGLDFKKAITDYLTGLKKLITEKLAKRYPGLSWFEHVLKIMTVPAEYNDATKAVMRKCCFDAGITERIDSTLLEFTTEPEAAAIYCMRSLARTYQLNEGDSFLIVDCGGGTVDLTTRTMLKNNRLGEITMRTGDFCGSTFVDREFQKWLGQRHLGMDALRDLRDNHYGALQYLIHQYFITTVKLPFTGNPSDTRKIELDLEQECPMVLECVKDEERKKRLQKVMWMVDIEYENVKEWFDPHVDRIIDLIGKQLNASGHKTKCMFMVGGFSESPYLINRVREVFDSVVPTICVPQHPIAAVVRGAVYYGLDMETVQTRTLKWTYGLEVSHVWREGDPPNRRGPGGYIQVFHKLATRAKEVAVDEAFVMDLIPIFERQTEMNFPIYYTPQENGQYCDDPGMKYLGLLTIELPHPERGFDRPVEFKLSFGKMEISAAARNKNTNELYSTQFKLDF